MTALSIELRLLEAVESELKAIVDIRGTVQRRLMPLLEKQDLLGLQVTPYWDGGKRSIDGRGVDHSQIIIGVAIQQAVPHAESNDRGETVFDGIDNLTFADTMFALAAELQDLWGPDGDLRDNMLAGCVFQDIDQDQLYEPMHLLTHGVMSIVFTLTYGYATS